MFELIDVNSAVQELALLVGPMLESRNINASSLLLGTAAGLADRDSLHQVFLNLVNNSCDAMPNGGELEIATRYLSQNQQVEIMFSDSGAGIALDVVEHLFEPMFTTKQSGSGLGLVTASRHHRGTPPVASNWFPGSSGAVFCWRPGGGTARCDSKYTEAKTNAA